MDFWMAGVRMYSRIAGVRTDNRIVEVRMYARIGVNMDSRIV